MSDLAEASRDNGPGVAGWKVVLGIVAFAVLLTGVLWIYTYQHNAPYAPYRKALVAEFTKRAVPRVDGGREKGRGPMLLRVVLSVDFDPRSDSPQVASQVRDLERRAFRLAVEHVDLTPYDEWEFCLVHVVPEGDAQRQEWRHTIAEARELFTN